jgi:hypothetical protein
VRARGSRQRPRRAASARAGTAVWRRASRPLVRSGSHLVLSRQTGRHRRVRARDPRAARSGARPSPRGRDLLPFVREHRSASGEPTSCAWEPGRWWRSQEPPRAATGPGRSGSLQGRNRVSASPLMGKSPALSRRVALHSHALVETRGAHGWRRRGRGRPRIRTRAWRRRDPRLGDRSHGRIAELTGTYSRSIGSGRALSRPLGHSRYAA